MTLCYNASAVSGPVPISMTREQSERPDMTGCPGRLAVDTASGITKRITALAVIVGVLLTVGKTAVFAVSGSVGVLASLVHSVLDMTGAVASFFAVRFAARAPSGEYRFGRGKAEGVAAVFQMCLIVLASVHLLEESLAHVFNFAHNHSHPAVTEVGAGLMVMAVLAALTLWLIIAQTWAVRATGSIAVRGDRAHYTADLLATVVVMLGLALSVVEGLEWVDSVVGVAFSLWLLWTAAKLARLAWNQLMDKEIPDEERAYLANIAQQDARVRDVSALRTRAAGPHIHIQMQVDLEDGLSLTEAHEVCVGVERRIRGVYRAADVSVVPHPVACAVH